jgi:AAA15 family ATPase/GTPase
MLYSISFKNFFSFKERTLIDLTVDGKAPGSTSYFDDGKGQRLTKILAIFGANASGKTNALRAIAFVRWFICKAWDQKPNNKISYLPFLFSNSREASEIAVTFGVDGNKYIYEIALNNDRVLSEKLQRSGVTKPFVLFSRELTDSNNYNYNFNNDLFDKNIQSVIKSSGRSNASLIASAVRGNHELSLVISNLFQNYTTNVNMSGRVFPDDQMGNALNYYLENSEAKDRAVSYLKQFDIGLTDITISKKSDADGETLLTGFGLHGKKKLPLVFESFGTRNLAVVLHHLLPALDNGGLAFIDELDSDLHPMILAEIVKIFLSPSKNPKNAQLVFSAHSPSILNDLDKQQVVLVEKNDFGESTLWRLSDMSSKDARSDSNYYAKYMAGAYGGVPRI